MTTCAYKDCFNLRRPGSSIIFFKLPVGNLTQREQWITNSGNPDIKNLAPNTVRHFCEEHFHEKDIRRQFHRATLARDAVPLPYESQFLVTSSSGLNSTGSIDFVETATDPSSDVMVVRMELNESKESENQYEIYEIDEEDLSAVTSPPLKRKRLSDKFETVVEESGEPVTEIVEPIAIGDLTEHAVQATPAACAGKGIQTDPETKHLVDSATNTEPLDAESEPKEKSNQSKIAPKLDEDEYFCLNVLCGLLKKIPQAKKTEAKMNLLTLMYKADTQD